MAVIRDMMPAFELFQPASIDEALALLDTHGAGRRAFITAESEWVEVPVDGWQDGLNRIDVVSEPAVTLVSEVHTSKIEVTPYLVRAATPTRPGMWVCTPEEVETVVRGCGDEHGAALVGDRQRLGPRGDAEVPERHDLRDLRRRGRNAADQRPGGGGLHQRAECQRRDHAVHLERLRRGPADRRDDQPGDGSVQRHADRAQ